MNFAIAALSLLFAAAQPDCPYAPRVDYHQHLFSPAGVELLNEPLAAAGALPPDLARLLALRTEGWNDKAKLDALFADDAVVIGPDPPGWLKGRDNVTAMLSSRFARAFAMTPVSYSVDGNSGSIAGFYTRGDRHFGYFFLALKKNAAGEWRIAAETPALPGPPRESVYDAADLVKLLDGAGIEHAVVLSDAYFFDSGRRKDPVPDAYEKMKAENDWTAAQVARFPDRLVAFCSFNPLKDYALAELDRCAANPVFRGLKLHFGESAVDLLNPEHVAKVRRVFEAANRHRLPVIVHVRADRSYGREHALVVLHQLLPAAPDVPVQIAHLWGGEAYSDAALAAYADAVAAHEPETKNLYFDVAELALVVNRDEKILKRIAELIRRIGPERVLFGSDSPPREAGTPKEAWKAFRTQVPLTDAELRTIAGHVLPYITQPRAQQPPPATADAESERAWAYHLGVGVPANDVEAVKWERLGAEKGQASDDSEAVAWYRRAAKQNDFEGQLGLGRMYAAGRGVPKDEWEALRWFERAEGEEATMAVALLSDGPELSQARKRDYAFARGPQRQTAFPAPAREREALAAKLTAARPAPAPIAKPEEFCPRLAEVMAAATENFVSLRGNAAGGLPGMQPCSVDQSSGDDLPPFEYRCTVVEGVDATAAAARREGVRQLVSQCLGASWQARELVHSNRITVFFSSKTSPLQLELLQAEWSSKWTVTLEVDSPLAPLTLKRSSADGAIGLDSPVDFKAVGAGAGNVAHAFAELLGADLVIDLGMRGKVTLDRKNVPMRDALDAVCAQLGCTWFVSNKWKRPELYIQHK